MLKGLRENTSYDLRAEFVGLEIEQQILTNRKYCIRMDKIMQNSIIYWIWNL